MFDHVGDMLPMHTHNPITFHDIKVIKGKIRVRVQDWAGEIIGETGDFIELVHFQCFKHQVEALEDDTEILNIYRHSTPDFEENVKRDNSSST